MNFNQICEKEDIAMIKAYGSGNANRGTAVRPTSQQRRGNESMGAYYRRTGQSALGGNARTRGRLTTIRSAQ